MTDPLPAPIGLVVNRVVAARVRSLVDEYGAACSRNGAEADRSEHLGVLLRAACRNLRLDAVEGQRYRLTRIGEHIQVRLKAI